MIYCCEEPNGKAYGLLKLFDQHCQQVSARPPDLEPATTVEMNSNSQQEGRYGAAIPEEELQFLVSGGVKCCRLRVADGDEGARACLSSSSLAGSFGQGCDGGRRTGPGLP